MTKAHALREHDLPELNQRLEEARKELFNLRFQLATGRLDNITRITVVRREIARLLTLLHEAAHIDRPIGAVKNARRSPAKATEEE
ncbi:MAG TPA: 50S ribosomal protein L29 [Acidimicrobiales bacterium]|nr:50S ribosomal protein L29 [Acidimicrobiales bacterium]